MGEARTFGRYLEDFEVGDIYKHWPGKTITEYDDHLFCMITMNHHPLHTNAHYAETQTQFGRNVVVGNLVYSLALGMSVPDVSGKAIANLEVESLQHRAPMFHGDTLYAETKVLDVKPAARSPTGGSSPSRRAATTRTGPRSCTSAARSWFPGAARSTSSPAVRNRSRPAEPPMGLRRVDRLDGDLPEQLHRLYLAEWWTNRRSADDVRRMLEGSDVVIGFVDEETGVLAGFARVLTDFVYKALCST